MSGIDGLAPLNGVAIKFNDRLPEGISIEINGALYMSRLDYYALAWSCAHREVMRLIREMFADARLELLGKKNSSEN